MIAGSNPAWGMDVCAVSCKCRVFSGRALCNGAIKSAETPIECGTPE